MMKKNWIETTIKIISILVIIYMGLMVRNTIELIFLPISYFIIISTIQFCVKKEQKDDYKLIINATHIITFIRYVITPLISSINNKYIMFGPMPSKGNFNLAIMLMVFELIGTYATIVLGIKFFLKKQNIKKDKLLFCKNKLMLLGVVLFSLLIIFLTNNYNLLKLNNLFVIDAGYQEETVNSGSKGAILILLYISKIFACFLLLSVFKEKYDNKGKKIYIFLSLIVSFVFLATMMGTSRWTMLFSAVIVVYMLVKMYPQYTKLFVVPIVFITIVSVMSISIYKNSTTSLKETFAELSQQFDYYFSGVGLVAQSIEMSEQFSDQITLQTLVNDFTGSIPYIAKFVDQTNRTNVYFNVYNYFKVNQTSLIIPMIGNCYCYFPFFPILYTVLCMWFALLCNKKMNNTEHLELKVMYLYMFMYLILCFAFNSQIIFGYFIGKYIYIIILLNYNIKIKFKKR